jgi:hypothetical protein
VALEVGVDRGVRVDVHHRARFLVMIGVGARSRRRRRCRRRYRYDVIGVIGEHVRAREHALEDSGALRLSLVGWHAAILRRAVAVAVGLAQGLLVLGILATELRRECVQRFEVGGDLAAQAQVLVASSSSQSNTPAGSQPGTVVWPRKRSVIGRAVAASGGAGNLSGPVAVVFSSGRIVAS